MVCGSPARHFRPAGGMREWRSIKLPIYEYACLGCGHEFEKIQKVSDAAVRKCPACGRLKARRLISRSSFVLKGDGWYVTDYPSKDRKAAMKSESDGQGKTGKTAETAAPSSGQADNGSDGPPKKTKASKDKPSKSKTKSD